ncbi:HNH endonuclease [Streptomyces viridosporus]|uniref:HNH endonuclease n=1 Tax=Streptomyces viridosporus TaxID=67581 RepID=UPI0034CE4C72
MIVHHLDEDPANNRVENLILLCYTCHAVHHKSAVTPYPWFAEYTRRASESMTSKWKATATSLLTVYSSTTAS